jgi:hypothetical protein
MIFLDLYVEDYLKTLNISSSQLIFILKAIDIDYCQIISNQLIPDQESVSAFLKKDVKYLIFKVKNKAWTDTGFEFQYDFIEFNSFEEMDSLIKKYIKLKAFI